MSAAESGHVQLRRLTTQLAQQSPPSFSLINELLTFLTTHHIHSPKLVAKYGRIAIVHYRGRMGDKVWDMYERVFIAALDAHLDETVVVSSSGSAAWSLEALLQRFGNSGLRLRRLLALHSEYHCRWEEAVEQYESILQQEPTNLTAHKRLIAVARARGRQEEAISRLVRYTRTFASDESGWLELCERYVEQQQEDLAAFCAEELLLITPENHLYHTRYAELLYAGGRYELARQYFAQSVELMPDNNLRALYGIIMCLRVRPVPSCAPLYAWAMEKLLNHYRKYSPSLLPIVQQSLDLALPQPQAAQLIKPTAAAVAASSPATSTSTAPPASALSSSSSSSSASTAAAVASSSRVNSVNETVAGAPTASSGSVSGSKLSTSGIRITDAETGQTLRDGPERDEDVEKVASVLAATGLRERSVAATAAAEQ